MITLANKPTISEKTDDCKVGIVVATGDLNTVLQGRAPATGITIEQTVDYAISKSLNQDFIVDTFGDSPVRIILEGIEFLTEVCNGEQSDAAKETVEAFYDKNKLSADNVKRVALGLSSQTGQGQAFTCVLTGMRSVVDRESADKMYIKYNLTLIGVRNI